MSNKAKAVESLYYRLEALADQFVKASGDEAVAIAKKINVYGRAKEILNAEIDIEESNADKPAQEAPKPTYPQAPAYFGAPAPAGYGQYGIRNVEPGESINW